MSSNVPNLQEIARKSVDIYNSISDEEITSNAGKYVAVDVEAGEYFIADTREEAVDKAKEKHPKKIVFVRRIGAVEKMSYHSPIAPGNIYRHACLF